MCMIGRALHYKVCPFDINISMSGLVTDSHRSTRDKIASSSSKDWDTWLPLLPHLNDDFPWSLNDVSKVLRLGRAREHFRAISPQTIERVCFLLQRPLLRIVIEAERLSHELERCTKRELQTSIRLILSPLMAKNCLQLASKALLLYSTSGEQQYQRSKRARSGLIFPVGRIFGWLVEMKVSRRIYDAAVIYLSAALEFIAEETVYRAVVRVKETVDQVTPEMVESCISTDPELWCLYQPYVHLLSGRTSCGLIDSLDIYACKSKGVLNSAAQDNKVSTKTIKPIEPYFLTTCVSSADELREIVSRVQNRFSQMNQTKENRVLSKVEWLPSALEMLFYFMNCSHNLDGNMHTSTHALVWNNKRTHHCLPPLTEWIRVAGVHAEHRVSGSIDDDDIRQAARLLLPFNLCSYRTFGPDVSFCTSRTMTLSDAERSFKTDLGLRMLLSGRSDLVPKGLALFGTNKGNSMDLRGLTPLMYACAQGNAVLVRSLLDNHAFLDTKVPKDKKQFPLVDSDLQSWTALSFAVSKQHLQICQMLLDAGANVDGAIEITDISDGVETPLQMAVAAGNYELVSLLCARKADINITFPVGVGKLGFTSPFAAAAAFGYRKILRKLLAEAPSTQPDDEMMSLAEILAEGSMSSQSKPKRSLSKKRSRVLQDAMYHSCEHGFLDIAMEIRSLGVPWNLHCWSQAVYHSYNTNVSSCMTSQMRCLLRDFHSIQQCEYSAEFCDEGLLLLFTIFKECQDQELLLELASVFSSCYGNEPLPIIKELPSTATQPIKIGASYVNNHEMADVTFLVENQPFYGHRIILASASTVFKDILSSKPRVQQDSCIEIPDIKYSVFSLLMQHVYTGRVNNIVAKHGKLLELLHASYIFKLEDLQRQCERLLSTNIDSNNVVKIYKCSKHYKADSLARYCECFILSYMKEVTEHGDLGALMLTEMGSEILSSLQLCLSERIKAKVRRSPRKSLY